MAILRSTPLPQLTVGQQGTYSKTVTEQDILLFAIASGDHNPIHVDAEYAKTTPFGERIAHGMLSGALISAALATVLPGPGGVYRSQTLKFSKPVKIGDTITVTLEVTEIKERIKLITIDCVGKNQLGEVVVKGTAEAIVGNEVVEIETPVLPTVVLT